MTVTCLFETYFVSELDILFDMIVSLSCVWGGWQEEERVVLELDLVVPLKLNISLSYLNLEERQARSIFVMCVKL